jgi:hypothetical protein
MHKNCTSPGSKKWHIKANERQAIPTHRALGKISHFKALYEPKKKTD